MAPKWTANMQTIENTAPRLIRLPDVQRATGLRRSALYRLARNGQFPKPLKIGPRSSAWRSDEVDSWILAKITEAGAREPTP